MLSFPSVPEWPRADRALGLAALERETALLRIFSAGLFLSFFLPDRRTLLPLGRRGGGQCSPCGLRGVAVEILSSRPVHRTAEVPP